MILKSDSYIHVQGGARRENTGLKKMEERELFHQGVQAELHGHSIFLVAIGVNQSLR